MTTSRRTFLRAVSAVGAAAAGAACRTELPLGEGGIERLWFTELSSGVGSIAVGDQYVCIARRGVLAIPKSGVAPTEIASPHGHRAMAALSALAAHGDTIYARTDSDDCWQSKLPNGPARLIFNPNTFGASTHYDVTADERASYWVLDRHVHRVEHETDARLTVIIAGGARLRPIGEDVYVATYGALQRRDRRTLALLSEIPANDPTAIAVDARHVYWFDFATLSFWFADRDLGNTRQLRPSLSAAGRKLAKLGLMTVPMESDGDWLYHGAWDESGRLGFFAVPSFGGQPIEIVGAVRPHFSAHRSIGVDARHVYWVGGFSSGPNQGTGVYRMPRLARAA